MKITVEYELNDEELGDLLTNLGEKGYSHHTYSGSDEGVIHEGLYDLSKETFTTLASYKHSSETENMELRVKNQDLIQEIEGFFMMEGIESD